jgi:hypothetical protein
MPQKAIILDYLSDCDAPPTPFKQLFVLPDDENERNWVLGKLWYETFVDLDMPDDLDFSGIAVATGEDCSGTHQSSWGDLIVGDEPYLLVTFLEEPYEIRLDDSDYNTDWERVKRAARGD